MIPYNFIGDIIHDKYAENIDGKKKLFSLVLDQKYSVPEASQAVGVSDTFLGTALVGSYDFTSLLSVSGHFYALEYEVSTAIKMDGYDLMLRAGKNDLGFIYFGALGLYSETMSASTSPLTFDYSGALLGYGIGYN